MRVFLFRKYRLFHHLSTDVLSKKLTFSSLGKWLILWLTAFIVATSCRVWGSVQSADLQARIGGPCRRHSSLKSSGGYTIVVVERFMVPSGIARWEQKIRRGIY